MLPAAVRSASASTVRVFRSSIQSSSSRCVRFKTIVADDPATLATRRALPPTRSTGWIAPASPGARKQILNMLRCTLTGRGWKRSWSRRSSRGGNGYGSSANPYLYLEFSCEEQERKRVNVYRYRERPIISNVSSKIVNIWKIRLFSPCTCA
jgi:hypothetical protein